MRVRHLQTYLTQLEVTRKCDLSEINDCRLGIDAVHWLRGLEAMYHPFSEVLGGNDLESLETDVLQYLENFKKNNITPLFVFPGIEPKHQVLCFGNSESIAEDAWNKIEHEEPIQEKQCGRRAPTGRLPQIIFPYVFQFLVQQKQECFGAPYLVGPQLAYFKHFGYIDVIHGPPSLLLFGPQRVLTSFDFASQQFEWIDQTMVFSTLDINRNQFLDAMTMAGTDYCFTLPYLNLGKVHGLSCEFSFGTALEFAKQSSLGSYVTTIPQEMRTEHVEGYAASQTMINRAIILDVEGQLKPVDFRTEPDFTKPQKLPKDYHQVTGTPLPKSLALLMAAGIISAQLPTAVVHSAWNDVINPTYETLERTEMEIETRQLKNRIISFFLTVLPAAFSSSITFTRQLECNHKVMEQQVSVEKPVDAFLRWNFTKDALLKELQRQQKQTVNLIFCLTWHAEALRKNQASVLFKAHESAATNIHQVEISEDHVRALVYFKFLEILQYFSAGKVTVFGSALITLLSNKDANHMSMFLALELMKLGLITGDLLLLPNDKPYPPHNASISRRPNEDERSLVLLSRIFSLVQTRCSTKWSSGIDYDLAAYHTIVSSLSSTLSCAMQAAIAHTILNSAGSGHSKHHLSFYHSLNITRPTRNVLGIVAKHFLEMQHSELNQGWSFIDGYLKSAFPAVANPVKELLEASEFWNDLLRIIGVVGSYLDIQNLQNDVQRADAYLKTWLGYLEGHPAVAAYQKEPSETMVNNG